MKIYDTIIVGAGPAGSMVGYILAGAGQNVLIIEKAKFPRRKVCGGGLTHRAYQQIPFAINSILHQSVSCGILGSRGRKITTIRHEQPIAYLIDRASFDDYLLQKAVDQGAECVQGERLRLFHEERGLFTLHTDQNTWYSRYLIGADGIHSLVAKGSGLHPNRETSLAYEALLSYPSNIRDPLIQSITFDFGTLLCGYGWIFPKQDHLNVGVFRNWPGKRTSKKHLLRYIRQHPILRHLDILDLRAFPGPLGGQIDQLHKHRLLLVGDAANLADPWLGEGLYYALVSGHMAAETIMKHAAGQVKDLSAYSKRVKEAFESQFMAARRLAFLVSSLPYVNVHLFRTSSTLQKMIIDLLRGERTHTQIWGDLKSLFPTLIIRLFKNNESKN